jgi:hypothetical protein
VVATVAGRPLGRYGGDPRRGPRGGVVAAVLAAGVALAWAAWAGPGLVDRDVRWNEVGYDVVDDVTLRVTYEVVKDPGATVRCTVQGLNAGYAVVGAVSEEIGPAEGRTVRRTVEVPTQERAVSGVVDDCTLGSGGLD